MLRTGQSVEVTVDLRHKKFADQVYTLVVPLSGTQRIPLFADKLAKLKPADFFLEVGRAAPASLLICVWTGQSWSDRRGGQGGCQGRRAWRSLL